jgi:hypothetical protein
MNQQSKKTHTTMATPEKKIRITAYEIYCDKFSQVIIASSLVTAVQEFEKLHPDEDVLFAENIRAKKDDEQPVDKMALIRATLWSNVYLDKAVPSKYFNNHDEASRAAAEAVTAFDEQCDPERNIYKLKTS